MPTEQIERLLIPRQAVQMLRQHHIEVPLRTAQRRILEASQRVEHGKGSQQDSLVQRAGHAWCAPAKWWLHEFQHHPPQSRKRRQRPATEWE